MSFHQLEMTGGDAIKLIRLLAFLNSDETLIEFLKAGSNELHSELKLIVNNNFLLRQSFHDLESYSLIRV